MDWDKTFFKIQTAGLHFRERGDSGQRERVEREKMEKEKKRKLENKRKREKEREAWDSEREEWERRFESNASYFEEVDRKALSVLEIMSDGMLVKKVYRGRWVRAAVWFLMRYFEN